MERKSILRRVMKNFNDNIFLSRMSDINELSWSITSFFFSSFSLLTFNFSLERNKHERTEKEFLLWWKKKCWTNRKKNVMTRLEFVYFIENIFVVIRGEHERDNFCITWLRNENFSLILAKKYIGIHVYTDKTCFCMHVWIRFLYSNKKDCYMFIYLSRSKKFP